MKSWTTRMMFFAIAGLFTAIPFRIHAQPAGGNPATSKDGGEEDTPAAEGDETMKREKFLALAEVRLESLDRHIGENDLHRRGIERLQERHRELTEEEDDNTYLRSAAQFARDLRRLETRVYGPENDS